MTVEVARTQGPLERCLAAWARDSGRPFNKKRDFERDTLFDPPQSIAQFVSDVASRSHPKGESKVDRLRSTADLWELTCIINIVLSSGHLPSSDIAAAFDSGLVSGVVLAEERAPGLKSLPPKTNSIGDQILFEQLLEFHTVPPGFGLSELTLQDFRDADPRFGLLLLQRWPSYETRRETVVGELTIKGTEEAEECSRLWRRLKGGWTRYARYSHALRHGRTAYAEAREQLLSRLSLQSLIQDQELSPDADMTEWILQSAIETMPSSDQEIAYRLVAGDTASEIARDSQLPLQQTVEQLRNIREKLVASLNAHGLL